MHFDILFWAYFEMILTSKIEIPLYTKYSPQPA